MLNKAMPLFWQIQTGNLVQLSPSLFSELSKFYSDSYNENIERLYIAMPNGDLILAWADHHASSKNYYARMVKANITGLYAGDNLKVSYEGHTTNVCGRSFAYQIVDFRGWFSRLEFLKGYRFKDLDTLRAFVYYIGSDVGADSDIDTLKLEFDTQVDTQAYEVAPATAA